MFTSPRSKQHLRWSQLKQEADPETVLRIVRDEVFLHFRSLSSEIGSPRPASKRARLSTYFNELRYGTSNKSGESGYTTLRIPNIIRGTIDLADLKTVEASENEFEKLRLQDGDVLFVRTNGNPDYVDDVPSSNAHK